ncbi:MAG TPA: glycosyltransferase [Pyrinomonadaceae bacterium]|nr:glycosyltransferase [Pyrinomonadaceae bacterium]
MSKVAIVVQRCHQSVVGGSESLAWQYANLLKDSYDVDVLTTTALDAAYWANALPEGLEVRDGINIHRFKVDIGYTPYRTELFTRMIRDFGRLGAGSHNGPDGGMKHIPWSISLQEEFVRRIGPYSESLVMYLRANWPSYRAIIFVTYLYPTAYFGINEVPRGRALFAPTLHDEEPAYLSVYKHAAHRAHSMIWLTEAEARLGQDLWGTLPGQVVAMAIEANVRVPADRGYPYLLYCGRIDPNKGCIDLFDFFIRFKKENPSDLRLVLTGTADVPVPDHPEIEFDGFVTDEEKLRLMAGAVVYVMPSAKESFSIVTLEAMAQKTPVLATKGSNVLADHVKMSGGGATYEDYESFGARLSELLADEDMRKRMGEFGRRYVISRYTEERVRKALIGAVESCPEPDQEVTAVALSDIEEAKPAKPNGGKADAPPLPLPEGWIDEDLRKLVSSVLVEDGPPDEMKNYANSDFRRFVYTLSLVPNRSGISVLELGANPYFMTVLLSQFRQAKLQLANFFGGPEKEGSQKVSIGHTGETLTFPYKHFNVEVDTFPYPDDSFDVVLFCEIIEHLLSDPVQALTEIRRVLRPGGTLVLTTPNVVRLANVQKIIDGENIYDPYSGYGPYGRHNREYTAQDLVRLLSANGFTVRTIFTADVNDEHYSSPGARERVASLVRHRQPELGQYIFCQSSALKVSKGQAPVRADWLYRSLPEHG